MVQKKAPLHGKENWTYAIVKFGGGGTAFEPTNVCGRESSPPSSNLAISFEMGKTQAELPLVPGFELKKEWPLRSTHLPAFFTTIYRDSNEIILPDGETYEDLLDFFCIRDPHTYPRRSGQEGGAHLLMRKATSLHTTYALPGFFKYEGQRFLVHTVESYCVRLLESLFVVGLHPQNTWWKLWKQSTLTEQELIASASVSTSSLDNDASTDPGANVNRGVVSRLLYRTFMT